MKKLLLASLVSAVLVGCGSSGSGSDSSPLPPAVTPPVTTVTPNAPSVEQPTDAQPADAAEATGMIRFVDVERNLIYLNQAVYAISRVNIGDQQTSLDVLEQEGINLQAMNVRLVQDQASVATSEASTATYTAFVKANITGVISAVTPDSFTINGQQIQFDHTTFIADDIELGDLVMVSTKPIAQSSNLFATAVIELEDVAQTTGSYAEIEGKISHIDLTANRITVGQFTLSLEEAVYDDAIIGGATVPVDIQQLSLGVWVELAFNPQTKTVYTLAVERFDFDDFVPDHAGKIYEVEGIVTWLAKDFSSLTLNHQHNINLTAQTLFEDGQHLSQLRVGQELEVDYQLKTDNGITSKMAVKVEIDDVRPLPPVTTPDQPLFASVEGRISQVAADRSSFTVNNVPLTLTANTQFDYGESAAMLTLGREVEVDYLRNAEGINEAQYIDVDLTDWEEDNNHNGSNGGLLKEFECEGVVQSYEPTDRSVLVVCQSFDADPEDLTGQQTIFINNQTRFEHITEGNLVDQRVSIDGVTDVNRNQHIAQEIELETDFD